MKAQVFYEPRKMQLEQVPKPSIGAGELLIEVKACGICGSDVAYYYGKTPLDTASGKGPLILGHEFSGVVREIGPDVVGVKAGDRVTVNPPLPCNRCEQCQKGNPNLCDNVLPLGTAQNGALAEFVKAPFEHVYVLPDGVSFEQGAIIEPFACAMHGVQQLDVHTGDSVAIIGAGTIGLMMLKIIKASGAGNVFVLDIADSALSHAQKFGADHLINTLDAQSEYFSADPSQKISELTGGKMVDKVIVPTGALPAMEQAFPISGKKADIVFFGLPSAEARLAVPVLDTLTKEKTIKFSWLAPLVWLLVMRTLEANQGLLDGLITHRFKLEELENAIAMLAAKEDGIIKAVIVL